MPQDPKAIIAAFFEDIWNQGDLTVLQKYLASHYTIHHDPGDPWEGQTLDLDGFGDRLVQSRAPFPDQRFTIVDTLAEDDRVAVSWTWEGTHLADMPGFPATGKVIRFSGLTIYGFDAKIRLTGHWQVTDRLAVFQQLSAPR
jgi:steroid delta-isomerase-like uncharacterized protein